MIVAAAVEEWRHDRAEDEAYAAAWTAAGPPCPKISLERYAKLAAEYRTPVAFEDAHGDFAFGRVSCTSIDYDHGRLTKPFTVCQFSAPFVLRLDTPRGASYFEPGVGQPTTVSFSGGEATCVLGANDGNS